MDDQQHENPSVSVSDATLAQWKKLPVTFILVQVNPLQDNSGPTKILNRLKKHPLLPVTDGIEPIKGYIRAHEYLQSQLNQTALEFIEEADTTQDTVTMTNDTTVYDAWKLLTNSGQLLIPVLKPDGHYSGYCASQRQLITLAVNGLRPPRLGGLATPLGVYMTSGKHMSGAGLPGLIATGAMFAIFVEFIQLAFMVFISALFVFFPGIEDVALTDMALLQLFFSIGLLLFTIRLTPIGGLHGAEHMTIHAIEAGLPLTSEAVRTQTPEHRRCGTHIVVILIGFEIGWASLVMIRDSLNIIGETLYLLIVALSLLLLWRKLGWWLQTHFTTKQPTDAELESGLKAGREMLKKFSEKPHGPPTPFDRIWGSGILQVLLSFFATSYLAGQFINLINFLVLTATSG